MGKLADLIYKHAKLIIAFVILINVMALLSFFQFDLDTKFLNFFSRGNPKADEYTAHAEKYSSGEAITIFIEHTDSLLTKKNLTDVFQLQQQVTGIADVTQTASYIPTEITIDGLKTVIDENVVANNYESLKDFIQTKYFLTEQFLTDNEGQGMILVQVDINGSAKDVVSKLDDIVNKEQRLTLSLVGDEVIQHTVWGYLWRILLILIPCAIFLIIFIFYLVIRNRKLALLSMIPAGLAALWLFGTMFWSGEKVNIFLVLSPLFVIVMGSADGLHYVTHFLENVRKTQDKHELITKTLKMVGLPIILTTLTTMAGFGSLMWTDVKPMQQMGLFVTLGILYAGIISIFFLPAVLTLIKIPTVKNDIKESKLTKIILAASRKRLAFILIFVALIAVAGFYIPKLEVVSNQLMFFKSGSEIRQAFDKVETQFGSALPLSGELVAKNGLADLNDPELATAYLALERDMENLDGIHQVYSLFDIVQNIKTVNTTTSAQELNTVPAFDITQQLDQDLLNAWATDNGFKMVIYTKELTSQNIEAIENFVSENKNTIRTITGMPVLFDEMNRLVVRGQFQSLGLALVLIFIMLLITLRRFRAALVGTIPIAITIVCILGMLAITKFNLNILTANLSAIAIGVGVDYAIHLISSIYYYKKQGQDNQQSVDNALTSVSRPIIANALGLAIGLSVLFFSPLWIHTQAAAVMWVAMVISSTAALLLIPLFYTRRKIKIGINN